MIATLTKGSGGTYQVSARRYTDPWGVTRVGASAGSPDQRYCANLGPRQDDESGLTYWKYGTPPANNANFAWMQHMLHHLAPTGSMALLLANGSMASNAGGDGRIRKALVEADVVEASSLCRARSLPNAAFHACIWFLAKKSKGHRAGRILFMDAREMG